MKTTRHTPITIKNCKQKL